MMEHLLLALHVSIALVGIGYTTYLLLKPSLRGISFSYGFLAATILSGIVLVIVHPAALTQFCETGIAYSVLALLGIDGAKYRMGKAA
jgi:hypothetical protein